MTNIINVANMACQHTVNHGGGLLTKIQSIKIAIYDKFKHKVFSIINTRFLYVFLL